MPEVLMSRTTVRHGPGTGTTWRASDNIQYPPPPQATTLRFEIEGYGSDTRTRDAIRFSVRRDDEGETDNNIQNGMYHTAEMPVYQLPSKARGLFIAGVQNAPKPFTMLIYAVWQ